MAQYGLHAPAPRDCISQHDPAACLTLQAAAILQHRRPGDTEPAGRELGSG